MPLLRFVLATLVLAITTLPATSVAQLLSETVVDTTRQCIYAGSEANIDGLLVPRVFSVGLGQNCPATPPLRDPNMPVPPNAFLTGERTRGDNRTCVYEEGGIEYQIPVPLTLRCASTPALLQAARQARPDVTR